MAGEKRSFPFSDLDVNNANPHQNKWKKQCISPDYFQKNDQHKMSVNSLPEDIDMEYENCTDIHHKNGHITFEDFQNGYDSHMDVRIKDGYSLQGTYIVQNGNCQNSATTLQNGISSINNNSSFVGSSVCLRCQAGEPGHIGHIGR